MKKGLLAFFALFSSAFAVSEQEERQILADFVNEFFYYAGGMSFPFKYTVSEDLEDNIYMIMHCCQRGNKTIYGPSGAIFKLKYKHFKNGTLSELRKLYALVKRVRCEVLGRPTYLASALSIDDPEEFMFMPATNFGRRLAAEVLAIGDMLKDGRVHIDPDNGAYCPNNEIPMIVGGRSLDLLPEETPDQSFFTKINVRDLPFYQKFKESFVDRFEVYALEKKAAEYKRRLDDAMKESADLVQTSKDNIEVVRKEFDQTRRKIEQLKDKTMLEHIGMMAVMPLAVASGFGLLDKVSGGLIAKAEISPSVSFLKSAGSVIGSYVGQKFLDIAFESVFKKKG